MNTLEEFKSYLLHSKKKHSKATIKNYLADVNKFTKWTQKNIGPTYNPSKTTTETIQLYKLKLNKDKISPNSIERYMSSLRLFFTFLKEKDICRQNPFEAGINNTKDAKDLLSLNRFKLHLLDEHISKVTIKNYLLDVSQFTNWLATETESKEITPLSIQDYKYKLINNDRLAPASINRKLSSIRKYLSFLAYHSHPSPRHSREGGNPDPSPITTRLKPTTTRLNDNNNFDTLNKNQIQDYQKINENKNLQPTINIVTKLTDVISFPIVKIIESIQYLIWKLKGGKLFSPITPINKTNKNNNIPHKSLYSKIRHARPNWYIKYHSYPIVNYIHVAILLLFTTMLGIGLYKHFSNNDQQQKPIIASANKPPPKTLSFHGKLTDANNNPITAETSLRFSLYNNQFASGSAMLWQETQTITPDSEGQFTATLGQHSPISSDTFAHNPSLYIGMTVGHESELKPRHQVATLGLSTNSEQLNGLIPITKENAGTTNVILALDSSGNLTIGGKSSHTFQATGGDFTLSGKTLILTTTEGEIDLQKPIQNTTNNNNNIQSAQGAVEIDDLLAILATSSGQSALTINQNGTGPIISASGSGIAKFTLENNGTGTFAGNLIANGDSFTSANTSFYLLNSTKTISIGAETGTTTINNTLIAKGGLTIPATRSLIVSGNVASNLTPLTTGKYDLGSATNHWNNAYIDNLHASISGQLNFSNNSKINLLGNSNLGFYNNSSSNPAFYISSNGKIGLGTTNTSSALTINSTGSSDLFTASSSGQTRFAIHQNGDVSITGSLNTIPGDLAENYISSDYLEPGDVIMSEGKENNLAVIKTSTPYESKTIGIVSTKPGITLNSAAETDTNHPYKIPIALSGRVPVKVTTENGPIKAGDNLTTSSIQGVSMKATKPGTVIGKALEDYTNPNPTTIGKVVVFVNLSYSTGQDEKYNLLYNTLTEIKNQLIQDTSFIAENISLGGQTLTDYISEKIQSTVEKEIARQLPPLPTPVNPLATNSASLADASPSATYITNVTNIYQTPASFSASLSATLSATDSATPSASDSAITASPSGQIDNHNFLELLTSSPSSLAKFDQGLMSFGPSTLSDVAIVGNLNINGSLILANNAINTLGSDLEIQPLRQGNLSIMDNLVSIDTNGNLNVQGNATFAKNLSVKGTLSARIIAPIPDSDLIINLDNKDSKFAIQNASGSSVLSINHRGDIASSGSGKFANLAIIRSAQADDSLTQTTASSSAGTATITAYETERTIINPYALEDSLIYLTATSDTQGLTPYIARQTKEGSFTIAIPHAINADIKINWWIIN